MSHDDESPTDDDGLEREEFRRAMEALARLRPRPFHSWRELLSMLMALGYQPRPKSN